MLFAILEIRIIQLRDFGGVKLMQAYKNVNFIIKNYLIFVNKLLFLIINKVCFTHAK